MSDCDHSFWGDDICNNCGYSIGYLFIKAEQEIAKLKAKVEMLEAIECKYIEEIQEYAALKEQG